MKKQLILLISSITLIVLSLTTVVFAWFTIVDKTQEIFIYSGTLGINAQLFKGDSTDEIETISFDNVLPGDLYYFRLVLESTGTINGNLRVTFNFESHESLSELVEVKGIINNTTNIDIPTSGIREVINTKLNAMSTLTFTFNVKFNESIENMVELREFNIKSINIDLVQL